MNLNKHLRLIMASTVISLVFSAMACVQSANQNSGNNSGSSKKTGKIRIGLSMDTLKEERWQKDRDIFVKRAEELGAEVLVQAADGKDETQIKQAESLMTQGIDVLVVIPHNGEVAATIVDAAKRQNVPVISYDRLIRNSEPDLYISFDNEKVGEIKAQIIERDGKTTLTATVLYPSEEIRDIVIKSGMEHGAAESYDKLAELLASAA